MGTTSDRSQDDTFAPDDRPSSARVARFLDGLEENRRVARRAQWVGVGVGTVIAPVVCLAAAGVVPVEAEALAISASVIVAGLALGKR